MELANQQERRDADAHWLGGFFDGEGCVSICQFKKRRYTQFVASARIVTSSEVAKIELERILSENDIAYHIAEHGPSRIGSKNMYRFTISGYKRAIRFILFIEPYCRVKAAELALARAFINSRLSHPQFKRQGRTGSYKPGYTDQEIDWYIKLRDLHGLRLRESSETARKTLLERRYSPASTRKLESAAEMTAPAADSGG